METLGICESTGKDGKQQRAEVGEFVQSGLGGVEVTFGCSDIEADVKRQSFYVHSECATDVIVVPLDFYVRYLN